VKAATPVSKVFQREGLFAVLLHDKENFSVSIKPCTLWPGRVTAISDQPGIKIFWSFGVK